jgi:ribonucleotide reductase alpha subunit
MNKEYYWLNSHSRLFLERGYLEENISPEQRIRLIAENAEKILKIKGFADKFEDYMKKGFYSLATPVWTNFGNKRGLPVSCFGSFIEDKMESILTKSAEVGMMSKLGGGTSGYFGDLRPRGTKISVGGESSGAVHFMEIFDKVADVISQGCYDRDTEILTDCGWKFFKDLSTIGLNNIKVAQVNDDETLEFVKIENYFEYDVSENLIWFKDSKNIDLLVTKNHNMVYKQEKKNISIDDQGNKKYKRNVKDKFYTKTADECPLHRDVKYLHAAYLPNLGLKLSNWEKILIATQADGSYVKNSPNAIKYRFSKKRKADRLKYLLESLDIKYSYSYYHKDKTHNFYVNFQKRLPKTLEWVNVSDKSYDWCVDFISEILEWDGSKASDNSGVYSSIIKDNVDKVQEVCAVSGYKSYTRKNDIENEPTKSTIHSIYISRGNYFGVEKLEKQEVFYSGKVYCVEVPSHKIIIRRSGRTLVCGNSARRGSFAAYMPIEHDDIEEFLQIRSEGHPIQNMSIGVTVTDKFMKGLIEGDKEKRRIWAKVIQKRFETGYPYIMFVDNTNKHAPKVYKDKKLKVKASNLCVSADTQILTKEGELIIGENENKEVEVWNGKTWSKTKIIKTGENQKLIKFAIILREFDDLDTETFSRIELETTEYHKFYLRNGNQTEARNLKPGDFLIKFEDPKGKLVSPEIIDIYDDNKFGDTYCVNEPLEHKAVFNGILTGNCSEIQLYSDEDNSFVCVLSSLNLLHWDEIKETDAIETLVYFLDAVNEEFVQKTENIKYMEAAHNFSKSQRALGMGVLGWHSLLQSKMISFESMQAKYFNNEIWKIIREKADKATEDMAKEYGEPELLKGYGRRNVTTLAVAPTTSSSFILGQVSPSIEPLNSNYFVKNLAKGKFTYKNPYLKEVLKKHDKNNDEVWKSILIKGGSVQHLDFLTKEEKEVFKTFGEISQKEIVIQAAQRQKYIDQAQSLNIMIPPSASPKEVNALLIQGWELGIKTFYYQRSANPAQELARSILTCSSCEA